LAFYGQFRRRRLRCRCEDRPATAGTDSWSVFAEISFDVSDRSTVTYGGRFVNDDKDYIAGSAGYGVSRQLVFLPGVDSPTQDGGPLVCGNPAMAPPQ